MCNVSKIPSNTGNQCHPCVCDAAVVPLHEIQPKSVQCYLACVLLPLFSDPLFIFQTLPCAMSWVEESGDMVGIGLWGYEGMECLGEG